MKHCKKCKLEFDADSLLGMGLVTCPECGTPNKQKINLDNLKKAIEQKKNIKENNLIVNK